MTFIKGHTYNRGRKRPDLIGNTLTLGRAPWNKGLKMSDEQKVKISISRKGKCLGDSNPSKRLEVR